MEEYLLYCPLPERISSPSAMPAEENTLMVVSDEAEPVRLMRVISTAHRMPNSTRISVTLLSPSSTPSPSPASAL